VAEAKKDILSRVKSLKSALAKKRRLQGPVTAVEVDGSVLRVVSAAPRGGSLSVTRIAAEKLELPDNADRSDPAVMGAAIAKTIEWLGLKPGAVVMGVPRASVVLRTITVPIMDDARELASVVHFQIGKDLPFRLEEAVIDFQVRRQVMVPPPRTETAEKPAETAPEAKTEPPAPAPKLEVLVAAVQRDVVEYYRKTALAAGLKLVALGLLSHANARCMIACKVIEGNETVGLVSLRPEEVGIDVVAGNSLLFSRGASIKVRTEPAAASPPEPTAPADTVPAGEAPPPVEKQETFAQAVTIEVVRSLHSFGSLEPQSPASKIVVVGATEHEPEVVEAIQARLNLPCTWLDVAGHLELPKAARENAAGSIASIGLALGVGDPGGLPLDFLNPKRPAVKRNVKRIRLVVGTLITVLALFSVIGLRSYLIKQRLKIKDNVQKELTKAEKDRPTYKAMLGQSTAIKDWMAGAENWLAHYAYLTAILPPSEEIYITGLNVSGQGTIRMAVQARSGEILAKLDKQLRAAGYDVKPLAITPGNDRFGYDFRTSVELVLPSKMKVDFSKVRPPPRPSDDASLDPAVYRKGAAR